MPPSALPRPGRPQASLFQTDDRCKACAGRTLCGARHSDDACGDAAEYPRSSLTVRSAPNLTVGDLEFPTGGSWPRVADFGPSIIIGTRPTSPDCDALRLQEILGGQPSGTLRGQVAVLHGSDRQLIRLGEREGTIGPELRQTDAVAVIAPGFSTWWNWSPFDALIAIARSAHFAEVLARHLPTVPTVVWRTDADIYRWSAWIAARQIPTIALHLGSIRGPEAWACAASGIARLSQDLERRGSCAHLIVNGPSTIERMATIRECWRSGLTFASQNPWMLAQGGKRLGEDLLAAVDAADRRELECANRATFARVARAVVHRSVRAPSISSPTMLRDVNSHRRPA